MDNFLVVDPLEAVEELVHVVLGWMEGYFDILFENASFSFDVAFDEAFEVILDELEDHVLDELVLLILRVEKILIYQRDTTIFTTFLHPLIKCKISYSRLN